MMRLAMVCIALLCCVTASCQEQTKMVPNFDPHGKMVFVEDCDGKGGLLDYNFGDIVIYDPVAKQKKRMTHDKYYDGHPSWSSDGQKIVFESIRMDTPGEKGRRRIIDLTDPIHLFVLDIKTGRLEQFDKDFVKLYGDQVGEANGKPAWSPISNEIAFVTTVESFREKLVVLNLDNNTITSLTTSGQYESYDRISWSPSGDYLAFDIHIKFASRAVVILNTKNKETKLISNVKHLSTMGAWASDGAKLIFTYYHEANKKESGFYEYVLATGEAALFKKFENVVCDDAQVSFDGWEIVFNRYDWKNDSYDLWCYDKLNDTTTRLTTDGHERDGLKWYVKR